MQPRADARRLRSRRRRRRVARGIVRTAFWTLVLAGVFIMGIGYGRTLSGEDELRSDQVTVSVPGGVVTATLPTRTVTVTKTERVPATRPQAGTRRGASRAGAE